MKLNRLAGIMAIVIAATAAPKGNDKVPVLLELFTSEGCSSCPPADRLLEALDRQPVANAELIVLSEHVDYWNYLGWSDPFSSAVFTAREQKYSERLGESVYTPQLVIDGQKQVVGSDQAEVMRAIGLAAQKEKLPIAVQGIRSAAGVSVHVTGNSGGKAADLYIALATDKATSKVIRGENGGHVLNHVAVAQSILRVGKWEGTGEATREISIPASQLRATAAAAKTGEMRVVGFLQDPVSGRILGAGQGRF